MAKMTKCSLMFDYLNYAIVVATVIAVAWLRSTWNWVDDYNT